VIDPAPATPALVGGRDRQSLPQPVPAAAGSRIGRSSRRGARARILTVWCSRLASIQPQGLTNGRRNASGTRLTSHWCGTESNNRAASRSSSGVQAGADGTSAGCDLPTCRPVARDRRGHTAGLDGMFPNGGSLKPVAWRHRCRRRHDHDNPAQRSADPPRPVHGGRCEDVMDRGTASASRSLGIRFPSAETERPRFQGRGSGFPVHRGGVW
jgi:hypothetical protein